ncbi:MAG: hypothetical protein ACOY94_27070 [Bacillota bacterium]
MIKGIARFLARLFVVGLAVAAIAALLRVGWLLYHDSPVTPGSVAAGLYWMAFLSALGVGSTGMNSGERQHLWASMVGARSFPAEHRQNVEQRISFAWYAAGTLVTCALTGALLSWLG